MKGVALCAHKGVPDWTKGTVCIKRGVGKGVGDQYESHHPPTNQSFLPESNEVSLELVFHYLRFCFSPTKFCTRLLLAEALCLCAKVTRMYGIIGAGSRVSQMIRITVYW